MLSGVSWTTIFTNIFISWLWALAYLTASHTTTVYKWGFFAFGTFVWVILAMSTLNESREAAARLGISRDYVALSAFANLLWLLYPVAFGLGDGGNILSVTDSSIFVGILDILLVPVWSFFFLFMARRWNYSRLQLDFSEHRFSLEGAETQKARGTE